MGLEQLFTTQTNRGIIVTDFLGKAIWVNSVVEQLCGYSLTELWGKKPGEILQQKASDKATAHQMGEAVRQGRPFDGRILNFSKQGRGYEVEIHFAPVRERSGEIGYFIATEAEVPAGLPVEEQRQLTGELKDLRQALVQELEQMIRA